MPRRCIEGIAAVQIPFFVCVCARKAIYNSAIERFYVPSTLVIGCHWSCVREGVGWGASSWLFFSFPRPLFFSLSSPPPQPHSHTTWRPNPTRRLPLPYNSIDVLPFAPVLRAPPLDVKNKNRSGRASVLRLTRPHS